MGGPPIEELVPIKPDMKPANAMRPGVGCQRRELLLTATIDLEMVTAVRERIPVFADRRPDIY